MTIKLEQLLIIDKEVGSDKEYQSYLMDRTTLTEYLRFLNRYDIKRTAKLMLGNRAMHTVWSFEDEDQANNFKEQKHNYWFPIICALDQVIYASGLHCVKEDHNDKN